MFTTAWFVKRCAALSVFAMYSSIAGASSPLQHRVFTNGPALWVAEPEGILLYRNDTRSARSIVLCDTAENDTLRDILRTGTTLWALAASGLYQIDMSTTTIETLPGGKKGSRGDRIAADDDYVWTGLEDTLWRFDILGREWFPYPAAGGGTTLRGLFSDGSTVYCARSSSMALFSVRDEKWRVFPYTRGMTLSPSAELFVDKGFLVFADGPSIYRYIIDAQSWDVVSAPGPIVDILCRDTVIFYLTASGAFQYFTSASVVKPLTIPGIAEVTSFGVLDSALLCATRKKFIKYDILSMAVDDIEAPRNIATFSVRKTVMLNDTIIALCPDAVAAFDMKTRRWESVPFSRGGAKKAAFVWNDDNGARVNFGKRCSSQLRGDVRQDVRIDSVTAAGSYYSLPGVIADLTLHNQFSKGNYCDVFFDNSDPGRVAAKGFLYRGGRDEGVETGRLGTAVLDIPQSITIPRTHFEGGNVILQSKSSLETRDRKIVKAQAGAGLVTTKTLREVLPYSESGFYTLSLFKSKKGMKQEIIPGSIGVMVDGEAIDSADYSFVARTGSLVFNRHDLLDPTSLLTVSYQIRTVPDGGVSVIEALPENNFGTIGYGSLTVSPVEWLSPQVGCLYLGSAGKGRHELVTVSAPSELRTASSSLFFKCNPEVTFDAVTKARAAALSAQSRLGENVSLGLDAFLPDSHYVSADVFDRGYGFIRHDANFTAAIEPRKELPVRYSLRDIVSRRGEERRQELRAGAHFPGIPFFDVSLSRNSLATDKEDTVPLAHIVHDTIMDSLDPNGIDTILTGTVYGDSIVPALDREKEKFRVRLYETSSPFIESLLHINRCNYEFSYTGFSSRKEGLSAPGRGTIFFGRGALSPIKRLSFTTQGTYLKNAPGSKYLSEYNPSFILQTADAPPGLDISARNELVFKSIANADSSRASLRRSANVTMKPGAWWSPLFRIQPFFGIAQTFSCAFYGYDPDIRGLLLPGREAVKKVTTRGAGVSVFATNDLTFRNDNQYTTSDSATNYYSFNDLKWWFGDKTFWQTRWEYDRGRPRSGRGRGRDHNRGFSRFTNSWAPWLQTNLGVSSGIAADDSTDEARIGPDITVSITTARFFFIRSIAMNHTCEAAWIRDRGSMKSAPDISYSAFVRIVVMPNISFLTNNSFILADNSLSRYNGMISASVLF